MAENTSKMETTLGKARGLGSAKSGTHHWLIQRLTAVALIPLGLWFIISFSTLGVYDYETVRAWIATPWNSILLLSFVAVALWHSRLGLQVVIEDYVHHKGCKFTLLTLISLGWLLMAIIAFYSIIIISVSA